MSKIRIFTVLWETHLPMLDRIKGSLEEEILINTPRTIEQSGISDDDLLKTIESCDATIIYRQNSDFSERIRALLYPVKEKLRIINFANDPSLWDLTSVDHDVAVKAYEYMLTGGDENLGRMIDYVAKTLCGKAGEPLPPIEFPWQAVVSPEDGEMYESIDGYIKERVKDPNLPFVGVLASRPALLMDGLIIEKEMCRHLSENGLNPLLVFCDWSAKPDFGALSPSGVVKKFFARDDEPLVDTVIKMTTTFIGEDRDPGCKEAIPETAGYLCRMNVPVYQPVMMSEMTVPQWEESIGLAGDIAWHISFPEFEGIIDPYVVSSNIDENGNRRRVSVPERMNRLAERIANHVALRRKPNSEKRVAIFLNNYPCNGVEANVGNAAGLDSLESIADLMKRLEEQGYRVDPPKDGKELIDTILGRKALSEFRWTTIQSIAANGGVLHAMDVDEYLRYFSTLTEKAQEDVKSTWGEPPGKAMVLNNRILITGVEFGNVAVIVQPKRGCYGARCDGQVCKILHDPACPPTHQFLACYHYFEDIWGADAIVHTGTHGCMEWTPGKGVGMTESCYPDIVMRSTPHFYIYNSDNPSEGLVAKRRSYATLIDHMQHLMTEVNLYGGYSELDGLLKEYGVAHTDPVRSDELKSKIIAKAEELKFGRLGLSPEMSLYEVTKICHEELSRMRNSLMNKGLHVLGKMPQGDDLASAVTSIVRYGEEHDSLRDCICDLVGRDLSALYKDKGAYDEEFDCSNEEIIRRVDDLTKSFVGCILNGKTVEESLKEIGLDSDGDVSGFAPFVETIHDVSDRISSSDEIGAMVNALNGGFVPPGPSGYITRGEYRIVPTGRNFYSMDPHAVPSKSAYSSGCKIAKVEIERYLEDTGEIPESLGFFWTMGELISTGGEQMSQMMYLLGAEPVWNGEGRVKDFRILSLEELGRPRIDVSVNVSCILRDNMMNAIDFMDSVVSAVADLDEPLEMNFVRMHSLQSIKDGMDESDANARFFGAPPGTYTSGVNLAVFASAWKEDSDLANVFVRTKGHGYGGGRNGKPMYEQFATVLSRTKAVMEGSASDENDLLSCSCHFSNIGGMVSACRYLSDSEVKAYCIDTRDPRDISVGTLKEEIERAMRNRTLNPEWLEGMKAHGYKGANDIAKRVVRMFGWQATTHEVDDWLFDASVEAFVDDDEMREFFEKNNIYALEELERRLLEAQARGLWNPDPDTLERLKEAYLKIESELEEMAGDGEFQGGSIDMFTQKDVLEWDQRGVSDITSRIHSKKQ